MTSLTRAHKLAGRCSDRFQAILLFGCYLESPRARAVWPDLENHGPFCPHPISRGHLSPTTRTTPERRPVFLAYLDAPERSMEFTTPMPIVLGENGCGQATLIETSRAWPVTTRPLVARDIGCSIISPRSRCRELLWPSICVQRGCRRSRPVGSFGLKIFWALARYLDDMLGGEPDFLFSRSPRLSSVSICVAPLS